MGSDRVTEAAEELYAADPASFVQRRKALADAARADGDKDAAKRIAALRKPARAAWILNRMARADPSAPRRLETLAGGLRDAARAKDGRRLRQLSADRGELIDDLTGRALADVTDPPAGLREDVAATLTSALADPAIAGQFASGTLTRAVQWAGFGLVPASDAPERETEAPEPEGTARAARRPVPAREPPRAVPSSPGGRQVPGRARAPGESAARRRDALDDAERSVVTAMRAAAAAVAAEDRIEATVRDLEERLTKARAELADARLRARRAEAAERKARQLLDRLPRPRQDD